ncbi:TPA: Imm8 family immunity protein, partial [Neisseria gonorrhoeae]
IEHILKLINDILEICNSTSEDKSISNFAKYFDWEFDDYNLNIQD